ncbi:hypothetical protein B0T22DRAFT_55893 [Podospora appendiculata]|uniref:Transmembrane protein n=1 Tax=Podospora appendiculata TaxID=314037 RepID=A0AAE1CGY2_9PEZI|nr:hypothetical protein B0T22DRAFT_55893 [Podospora appendiculata]
MDFIPSASSLMNTALVVLASSGTRGEAALWWLLAQAAALWVGICLGDLFSIALQHFKISNPRRRPEPVPSMASVERHTPHPPDPPDLSDLSGHKHHKDIPKPRSGLHSDTSLHELEFLFELLDARENALFLTVDNESVPGDDRPADEQVRHDDHPLIIEVQQLGDDVEALEASQESLLSMATGSEAATSDDENIEPQTLGEPTRAHDGPEIVVEVIPAAEIAREQDNGQGMIAMIAQGIL